MNDRWRLQKLRKSGAACLTPVGMICEHVRIGWASSALWQICRLRLAGGTGPVPCRLADYRKVALTSDAIARAMAYAIEQPADVDVNEIIVRPTAGAQ